MVLRRWHPDLETLHDLVEGAVADGLRGRVERHVESCGECQREVGMRQDARTGLENIARLRARLRG
jgi:anti-sigma factor RsiW